MGCPLNLDLSSEESHYILFIMKICIFTNQTLLSDATGSKVELQDDLLYCIHSKFEDCNTQVDDRMFGGNKSAEDTTQGDEYHPIINSKILEEIEEVGDYIIDGNSINKRKKDARAHAIAYGKKLITKVKEEDNNPERAEKLKAKLNEFVKLVTAKEGNFKKWRFFCPKEDFDGEGTLMFFENCSESGDEEALDVPCKLYFFKDSVIEEKC